MILLLKGMKEMRNTCPGTNLPLTEWSAEKIKSGQAFSLITPILTATGGVTLSQLSRFTGLEGSTIQNWIKRGWVVSTTGKKYTEKQVARILLINILRGVMKLEDIANLMTYINGDVEDETDDVLPDFQLYNMLCLAIMTMGDLKCDAQFAGEIANKITDKIRAEEKREKLINCLSIMLMGYASGLLKSQMYEMYSKIGEDK